MISRRFASVQQHSNPIIMNKLPINRFQVLAILSLILNICLLLNFSLGQTSHEAASYGLSSKKWNKIQSKWSKTRFHVTITTKDDVLYEGQIFEVADDQVLLWPQGDMFLPGQHMEHVIHLDKTEIQSIHIQRKKDLFRGVAIGGLIGGIGIGILATHDTGEWAGLFFIVGATLGTIPGALVGGIISAKSATNKKFVLQQGFQSHDLQWITIRTYALFPNGVPEEIKSKLDKGDDLYQLQNILNASPAMASVFPAKLFSKE